jgi:hypothetical protein
MAMYRKKPVLIHAWPYEDTDACRDRLRGQGATIGDPIESLAYRIKTMEGWYDLHDGQMVIRGVRGEFYRCDRVIFNETYEEA